MKPNLKTIVIIIGLIMDIIVGCMVYDELPIAQLKSQFGNFVSSSIVRAKEVLSANKFIVSEETEVSEIPAMVEAVPSTNTEVEEVKIEEKFVYDDMTLDELANKLDRSLWSTLSGTGYQFASKSVELGVDPYMAVAIVLLETGCAYECSSLVNECYNVGGQKGAPGCYGGEYQNFSSLEEGINSFMDNLYYNYVAYGLNTPELINPKYAENTAWAANVNDYINIIKSR